MFRFCMCQSSPWSLFNLSPMCFLSHSFFRTSSLPQDPHSLFNFPVYIYLSLCSSNLSECWSFSVPSKQYARLLRFSDRHHVCFRLYDFCLLHFVLLAILIFRVWLLLCSVQLQFLPAPWYLCFSYFWFWFLLVFWLLFCLFIFAIESLITWLPKPCILKTTFSAFSLVCIWFLAWT